MLEEQNNAYEEDMDYHNIPTEEPETLDKWCNPLILSLHFKPDSRASNHEVNMEALQFLGLIRSHYVETSDDRRYDWLVSSESSSRALEDNSESMHCFGVTECPDSMDFETVRDAVVECWPNTKLGLHAKVLAPADPEWPFYKAMVEIQI